METAFITQTNNATTAGATQRAPNKDLDKNAFLMLLVAQLKSQDPTQSQDPNQMVQQMATFSGLEQMQSTNKLLEGIQIQNQGLFQAQASNLVGKRIRVTSSTLDLKDGKATVGLDLAAEAQVRITIKDLQGKVVSTLEKGTLTQGSHLVDWNGKDAQGNALPEGSYSMEVSALDAEGNSVKATPSAYVRAEAVVFLNGTVFVQAAGRQFTLSDIHEISA